MSIRSKILSMRKVAIFDIDGTIFRSSLLIEFTEALIEKGIFPTRTRSAYKKRYQDWLDRKGSYEKYIEAVIASFERNIKHKSKKDFIAVAEAVISVQKNHTYRYTKNLVRDLHRQRYYLLAISNSPLTVVVEFCEKLGFDKVYGRVYEVDNRRRFTGKVLYENLISDKAKILKRAMEKEHLNLTDSVGVGDTESDIAFLKLVDKPICFNPNKKLYNFAKKAGWKIVVERKDVIHSSFALSPVPSPTVVGEGEQ